MPSGSPLPPPPAPHSTLGRRLPNPPRSSATVLPPAFPPLVPKCSNGSLGPQDPLLPSDGRDWGEAHLADALLRCSLLPAFSDPAFSDPAFSDPAFPLSFPPVLPALPSYPVALVPAISHA